MFRFRVEDNQGKVLGIKNKMYEAQALYRRNYKEYAVASNWLKIVAISKITTESKNEDFNSLINRN